MVHDGSRRDVESPDDSVLVQLTIDFRGIGASKIEGASLKGWSSLVAGGLMRIVCRAVDWVGC